MPYTDEAAAGAAQTARSQAVLIRDDLAAQAVEVDAGSELVALIAYVQRLGRGPQPTEAAALGSEGR